MKISKENIEFYADNLLIKGVLHLPVQELKNASLPVVIGSHGLEGSSNSAKQIILSKILPQNNIGFLRFDHRGCGESEGDFLIDTTVPNRASDLISAVKYIVKEREISNNIGLLGSSLGGSTCIEAWETLTAMDIDLAGCVLCAAPIKSSTIDNVPIDNQADDNRHSLPLSFYVNNLSFDLSEKIKNIKNILVVHGKADEVVPVENAHILYDKAQDIKKLILFENGDHQTSSIKDQKVFENETLKWFKAILF
jgi:alpha-beta hydrolase superfamily lysophospholipase